MIKKQISSKIEIAASMKQYLNYKMRIIKNKVFESKQCFCLHFQKYYFYFTKLQYLLISYKMSQQSLQSPDPPLPLDINGNKSIGEEPHSGGHIEMSQSYDKLYYLQNARLQSAFKESQKAAESQAAESQAADQKMNIVKNFELIQGRIDKSDLAQKKQPVKQKSIDQKKQDFIQQDEDLQETRRINTQENMLGSTQNSPIQFNYGFEEPAHLFTNIRQGAPLPTNSQNLDLQADLCVIQTKPMTQEGSNRRSFNESRKINYLHANSNNEGESAMSSGNQDTHSFQMQTGLRSNQRLKLKNQATSQSKRKENALNILQMQHQTDISDGDLKEFQDMMFRKGVQSKTMGRGQMTAMQLTMNQRRSSQDPINQSGDVTNVFILPNKSTEFLGSKMTRKTFQHSRINKNTKSTTILNHVNRRYLNSRMVMQTNNLMHQDRMSPQLSLNQLGSIQQVLPKQVPKSGYIQQNKRQDSQERSVSQTQLYQKPLEKSVLQQIMSKNGSRQVLQQNLISHYNTGQRRPIRSTLKRMQETRAHSRNTAESTFSLNKTSQPQLFQSTSSNYTAALALQNLGTNYYIPLTQDQSSSNLTKLAEKHSQMQSQKQSHKQSQKLSHRHYKNKVGPNSKDQHNSTKRNSRINYTDGTGTHPTRKISMQSESNIISQDSLQQNQNIYNQIFGGDVMVPIRFQDLSQNKQDPTVTIQNLEGSKMQVRNVQGNYNNFSFDGRVAGGPQTNDYIEKNHLYVTQPKKVAKNIEFSDNSYPNINSQHVSQIAYNTQLASIKSDDKHSPLITMNLQPPHLYTQLNSIKDEPAKTAGCYQNTKSTERIVTSGFSSKRSVNIDIQDVSNSQDEVININLKKVNRQMGPTGVGAGTRKSNKRHKEHNTGTGSNKRGMRNSTKLSNNTKNTNIKSKQFTVQQQSSLPQTERNHQQITLGHTSQEERDTQFDTGRFAKSNKGEPNDNTKINAILFTSQNQTSTMAGQESILDNNKVLQSQMLRVQQALAAANASTQKLMERRDKCLQSQLVKMDKRASVTTGNFMKVRRGRRNSVNGRTPKGAAGGKNASSSQMRSGVGSQGQSFQRSNQQVGRSGPQSHQSSSLIGMNTHGTRNGLIQQDSKESNQYQEVYIGELSQQQFKKSKRIAAESSQESDERFVNKVMQSQILSKKNSFSRKGSHGLQQTAEAQLKLKSTQEKYQSVQALLQMRSFLDKDTVAGNEKEALVQSLKLGHQSSTSQQQDLFNNDNKPAIKIEDLNVKSIFMQNKRANLHYFGQKTHQTVQEALHGTLNNPHPSSYNVRRQIKLQNKLMEIQTKQNAQLKKAAPSAVERKLMGMSPMNSALDSDDEFNNPEKNPIHLANRGYHYKMKNAQTDLTDQDEDTLSIDPNNMDSQANYTTQENLAAMRNLVKHKILEYCQAITDDSEENNQFADQFSQLQEKFEKSKEANTKLYELVMNSLSQLLINEEDTRVIDNGVGQVGYPPLRVDVAGMSALFFFVKVSGKAAPMSLCLQDGSEFLRASNPSVYPGPVGTTKRDIQIYWSYEYPRPSENENEHDGLFTNNETQMIINPRGEPKFSQERIYFGIYAKEPLVLNDLLVGFGPSQHTGYISGQIRQYWNNVEKQRVYTENRKLKSMGQQPSMLDFGNNHDEDGKKKVITKQKKLKLFQDNINNKIKRLLLNDTDRLIFLNACDDIKESLHGYQGSSSQVKRKNNKIISNKLPSNFQLQKRKSTKIEIDKVKEDLEEETLELKFEEELEDSADQEAIKRRQSSVGGAVAGEELNYSRIEMQPQVITPDLDNLFEPIPQMTFEETDRSLRIIDIVDQDHHEYQNQMEANNQLAVNQKPHSTFNYYKKLQRKRTKYESQVAARDFQNYKYSMFMVVRQDLLKRIRNKKREVQQKKLNQMRRVKYQVTLQKLVQILKVFHENFSIIRNRRLMGFRVFLCCLKIQLMFRSILRQRYRATQRKLLKRTIFEPVNGPKRRLSLLDQDTSKTPSQPQSKKTTITSGFKRGQNKDCQMAGRHVKFANESMNDQSSSEHEKEASTPGPVVKPYQAELQQKLLRECIQPSFVLIRMCQFNLRANSYDRPKQIILDVLRHYRKKCDMVIFFQRTVQSVINMQRFVKEYFKRKLYWQAILQQRISKEIKVLRDFISLMRPLDHKKAYEWIQYELAQVQDCDVQIVCKRMIQYIKDLQVMDTYLFNTKYMSYQYTHEIIDGARKCLKRSLDELCPPQYKAELKNYPPYLLQQPDQKIPEKKKKKKVVVEATIKRQQQAKGGSVGRMMRAMAIVSREESAEEEEAGDERKIPVEEIEFIYSQLEVRRKEFLFYEEGDSIPEEPYIDIQNEMHQREQRPGMIQMEHSKKPKLIKMPTDDISFLYEFNSYNELVIFCAIEARTRKIREQLENDEEVVFDE